MKSVNTEFWGVDVEYQEGEIVVIDSAEVKGVVQAVRLDSYTGAIEYLVQFPYGSVMIGDSGDINDECANTGHYDDDEAWFSDGELRKIKPKKSFLERFFEEHKVFKDYVDLSHFNVDLFKKLDSVGK
jgi:hypothetical protein